VKLPQHQQIRCLIRREGDAGLLALFLLLLHAGWIDARGFFDRGHGLPLATIWRPGEISSARFQKTLALTAGGVPAPLSGGAYGNPSAARHPGWFACFWLARQYSALAEGAQLSYELAGRSGKASAENLRSG
jgi:hypothetical protein